MEWPAFSARSVARPGIVPMPQYQQVPEFPVHEMNRPTCPMCKTMMVLVSIDPAELWQSEEVMLCHSCLKRTKADA